MNSARFGFKNEIHSVRHALAILGDREERRWVQLIAPVGAGQNKTSALILCAPVRARLGELLTPLTRHGEFDLFLLGLLSMLDVMLEMPMSEILDKIPLVDSETKAVLRGEPGLLRPMYQLMLAQESGEWETARSICDSFPIDRDVVASSYWQAQQWAREVSGLFSYRASALDLHSTGMQSVRDQSPPIRSGRPDAARNYRRCHLVQNQPTLPLACLHTDEYH